ncbi:MAG: rhomboid family intramembrane serine protease [Geitlerinemataceae cyanobacterium]
MELEQLILWTVCLSCGLLWLKAIALPPDRAGGWAIVSGGILATTLAALYFVPTWAAWLGGGLWVMFVLIPVLGFKWVDRLCVREKYDRASLLASGLCWLHPADGSVARVRIWQGMALAHSGHLVAARERLAPERVLQTTVDRSAVALWYSINADWMGMLAWLRSSDGDRGSQVSQSVWRNNPDLMTHYLRALGETGEIDELIQEWERWESRWQRLGQDNDFLDRVRLYVWAFSGRLAGVQQCLEGGARFYPPQTQQFWLATAQMAAGQTTIARSRLMELQSRANFPLQQAIAWRLSQRLPTPSHLTPASLRILSRLETDTGRKDRSRTQAIPGKVYATFFLIGVNLVLFAIEVYLGGSQNPQVLDRLGAMVPEKVWEGQWWRLGSATFLHFGVGHLVMNMLGLYVLGISVEPVLGVRPYLLTYFTSGVGSMLVTAILARVQSSPETLVVGASGAVMGLIGALVAMLLASWYQHRSRFARSRLNRILIILGVQTIFDWLNPQICWVCHVSGALLGFTIASLLIRVKKSDVARSSKRK